MSFVARLIPLTTNCNYLLLKTSAGLLFIISIVENASLTAPNIAHLGLFYGTSIWANIGCLNNFSVVLTENVSNS